MKIREARALNVTEIYCCSKKSLKEAFKDRDVEISFGRFQHSRDMIRNSLYYLPKEKGKIIILLVFTVEKRREGFLGFTACSRMHIQSIDKNTVFSDLPERFEKEVIPKLIEFFDRYIDYDVKTNQQANELIVGVDDSQFKFYEKKVFKKM